MSTSHQGSGSTTGAIDVALQEEHSQSKPQQGSESPPHQAADSSVAALKRRLFIADRMIKALEQENRKLGREASEAKFNAAFEIENAFERSESLKQEVVQLRTQLDASGSCPSEENTVAHISTDNASPLPDIAILQAEIHNLKAENSRQTAEHQKEVNDLKALGRQRAVQYKELRKDAEDLYGDVGFLTERTAALRKQESQLMNDIKAYQEPFGKTCHGMETVAVEERTRFGIMDEVKRKAEQVETDFRERYAELAKELVAAHSEVQSRVAAIRNLSTEGYEEVFLSRATLEHNWNQTQSLIGTALSDAIETATKGKDLPLREAIPLITREVAWTEAASNEKIESEKAQTGSKSKPQQDHKGKNSPTDKISAVKTQVEVSTAVTDSLSVIGESMEKQIMVQENPEDSTQSEIERCQDLETQVKTLEQKCTELDLINSTVANANRALTKQIRDTLAAFIPKADKMLHQGTKMNKKSRDLLNHLIKIVRDGLRDS